jgi:hypothetical protein
MLAFGNNPELATVTFRGNAPTVFAATPTPDVFDVNFNATGSFDTTNPNFAVVIPEGNVTFGRETMWNGYRLQNPNLMTSNTDVAAAITAGTRSANLIVSPFAAAGFSHGEQFVDAFAELWVDDLTGANVGWNVTESVSSLSWTATPGGPQAGAVLPPSALSVHIVGDVITADGAVWSGTTGTGSLDSPVKVLSTSGGSGQYHTQVTLRLTLPPQASVGTYSGTITTTISAAP